MTFETALKRYCSNNLIEKYDATAEFPYFTKDGTWKTLEKSNWDDWISGFLVGINWLGHEIGFQDTEEALELTRNITPLYEHNFNIGFRYQYSWVPAFEATRLPEFKRTGLEAAARLKACFSPALSLLCHEDKKNERYVAANDAFMNIPLLLWASMNSPDGETYASIVEKFLDQSVKYFVKSDGSTRHRIIFDTDNLEILRVDSPQGIPGGCWSRGLAWTVNGLILGGLFFQRDSFIESALKLVSYHQQRTYSLIPAFDYSVSVLNRPSHTDTSAAAILSSSLLTLGIQDDYQQAYSYGEKLLNRLLEKYRQPADRDGLLNGGCFHYPSGIGINSALIWGDFYLLEALYQAEFGALPVHLSWLPREKHPEAQAS